MTQRLKYNTGSQTVQIGPFLSSTDGITAMTGLTIQAADIQLLKAGSTAFASKDSTDDAEEIGSGYYLFDLTTNDTNTPGSLILRCKMAGTMVVHREWEVLPPYYYEATVAGTAGLLQENFSISGATYSTASKMTGCTIKCFSCSSDATGGVGEIATYTMSATYDADNNLATYKVVKS